MSPQTVSYLQFIISVISVAFAVYMGLRSNRKADSEEREARIRTETRMDEKLNDVLSATKDTRDSVKELQRDLKNQNDRIITVEERVSSLDYRVEKVEQKLDGR